MPAQPSTHAPDPRKPRRAESGNGRTPKSDLPVREVRTIHDDVDPCTDAICCCEPEPRWQEVARELERSAGRDDR